MKKHIYLCSLILAVTLGCFTTVNVASAYPTYTKKCVKVSGYWRHGYWHPARYVCKNYYYKKGCKWVNVKRHGYWYKQRVCW